MSKLPDFGRTIFSVMSQLAADHDAINLSQGFPDFEPDQGLTAMLSQAALTGSHQYAPMAGLPELRVAISNKFKSKYGLILDPETEITITAGATHAIYTAIATFISPGDEVILIDPSYDSYAPSVIAQGGVPVRLPVYGPEFSIDWNSVDSLVSPKTRAIIVNNPNNPTGKVFNTEDLDQLADIAQRHDLLVLSDEVYEGIVFQPAEHRTVLNHPILRSRSIAVFSFGKTYHITGWKVGYCISCVDLMQKFRNLHQFLVFSVNAPAQKAIADYMSSDAGEDDIAKQFEAKRDYLRSGLVRAGFKVASAQGTYFQLADYSDIRTDLNEIDFARWLTIEHGVACIPLMPFYENKRSQNLVRFCFAKKDETLTAAIDKLAQIRFLLN